jgi:hypothetical protein
MAGEFRFWTEWRGINTAWWWGKREERHGAEARTRLPAPCPTPVKDSLALSRLAAGWFGDAAALLVIRAGQCNTGRLILLHRTREA